ncbi:hypothetical protein BDV23DRAFT_181726 [Aspergillus alliaceus]|uniref:Uncharacterized protein n=1 Tax=Petromyces alliaceus TaxID=209559 RepID=A0A5N7CDT4_PETAA|nr:hypothetical protein BDV23DRAFT_181726 [Aspergillus alliaceus]
MSQQVGFSFQEDSLLLSTTGRLLKALSDANVDVLAVTAAIQLGKSLPTNQTQQSIAYNAVGKRDANRSAFLVKGLNAEWVYDHVAQELCQTRAWCATLLLQTPRHLPSMACLRDHRLKFVCLPMRVVSRLHHHHQAPNSNHGKSLHQNQNTGIPTKPLPFRGDSAEDGLLFPNIPSSDDGIEGFFRLPGAQDDIPIDPVILANRGSWEDMDPSYQSHKSPTALSIPRRFVYILTLQPLFTAHLAMIEIPAKVLVVRMTALGQATTLISITVDICVLPNKAPVPTHPTLTVPMRALANGLEAPVYCRSGSTPPSFILTLCLYHSTSIRNSSSWLFKGALPRCISDYSLTASEQGDARAISHSTLPDVVEQARLDSTEAQESSRKGMKWSPEKETLLLKLRGTRSGLGQRS